MRQLTITQSITNRGALSLDRYVLEVGQESLSLNEIAIRYDMTGERVRQIKDKAIMHLRNPRKSNLLKPYL